MIREHSEVRIATVDGEVRVTQTLYTVAHISAFTSAAGMANDEPIWPDEPICLSFDGVNVWLTRDQGTRVAELLQQSVFDLDFGPYREREKQAHKEMDQQIALEQEDDAVDNG